VGSEEEVGKAADPREWIGVDLDGTLTRWTEWTKWNEFGEPIGPMVDRVKGWLAEGRRVKIFTARVSEALGACVLTGEPVTVSAMVSAIQEHLIERAGLPRLEVTCSKDPFMVELWDDRCVQVRMNTGEPVVSDARTASGPGPVNATVHTFSSSGMWYATGRGHVPKSMFVRTFDHAGHRSEILRLNGGRCPGLWADGKELKWVVLLDDAAGHGFPLMLMPPRHIE
jgi:hypothetical protein